MSDDSRSTLLVKPEILTSLDQLAEATRRSRTELAEEALQQYLGVQGWQLEGICEAIAEADSGTPGVPHDQVAEWLDSWGTNEELRPPKP